MGNDGSEVCRVCGSCHARNKCFACSQKYAACVSREHDQRKWIGNPNKLQLEKGNGVQCSFGVYFDQDRRCNIPIRDSLCVFVAWVLLGQKAFMLIHFPLTPSSNNTPGELEQEIVLAARWSVAAVWSGKHQPWNRWWSVAAVTSRCTQNLR